MSTHTLQMKHAILILLALLPIVLSGQHDTLWVKNGNVLYGEIKGLSSGVLTMETPYSDDDFTIDYDEVEKLRIERKCLILATGGLRMIGYMASEDPGQVTITEEDGEANVYSLKYINGIQQIRRSFFSRFYGNVDIGFNLTKANNQRQMNIGGGLHYKGFKWISDLDISSLVSNRDEVEETQRTNINLGLTRLLSKKWFIRGTGSFLSNTEQNLQGRYSLRVGAGQFLATTSKLMFAVLGGLNYNNETYQDETLDKESTELYFGSSLDMFNFKDFSLNTRVEFYPSLSEGGRLRVDYILNSKYDLPYDFYIKAEFQFNYDNQVVEGGSQFDYILNTGFGWKFD
ncbi:MAG: DUF481 domain-containing protein [Robiginitalea sp.]|jgi:hypothetical protein